MDTATYTQLPMFMSAAEIMERFQELDADREYYEMERSEECYCESADECECGPYDDDDASEAMWRHKFEEAEYELLPSLEEEGVLNPIGLGTCIGLFGKPQIVGGHHRTIVMFEIAKDNLNPVLFWHDIFTARRSKEYAYD